MPKDPIVKATTVAVVEFTPPIEEPMTKYRHFPGKEYRLDTPMSLNFEFWELTTTNHRSFLEENRDPQEELMQRGHELCLNLLEPIRTHFKRPTIISSGYRCPGLNKAVGGHPNSQHQRFEAADLRVSGIRLSLVFEWLMEESDLKWGQLILEGYSKGEPSWIHLSLGEPYRDASRCGEVFIMDGYLTDEDGNFIRNSNGTYKGDWKKLR